jgi:murein DD-endopeptidase MepM/ murein hydrolase activator NlpD
LRRRPLAFATALTVVGLGLIAPADAQDGIKEARQKREDARNAQLQAARQINLLTAADAEVAKALSDIEAAVVSQQLSVEDGRLRLADAQAQLVAREADLATARAQVDAATAKVQRILIERYVGQSDAPAIVFRAADAQEALRKEAALDFIHGSQTDAVNALQAARVTRDRAVTDAQDALAETDRLRQALEADLAELQSRLASQVEARAELQRRLATWRANQDQLERDEAALTDLIQKRQLEALKVTDATAAAASLKGFIAPAKGAYGSGFGLRMHPIFKETRPHTGVDIDAKAGDAVWAAKEGKTLYSGTMSGYGNVIILDHGNGVSSLYAHLSKILVNQGDTVKKGEVIGLVGSTGWATGPHLHFEVRVGGVTKDPMLFLP